MSRRGQSRNWQVPEAPPTPPPPPLPENWDEPGDELVDSAEAGLFYNRKTIDATEWEATCVKGASEPVYQVLVSGLPNQLLSDMMFGAILEQSGITEQVLGFKASKGRTPDDGQVLISLDSQYTAEWCACHFQGRNWGSASVTAEVVSAPQFDEPEYDEPLFTIDEPLWQLPTKPLLADAPEFVPSSVQRQEPLSGASWLESASASSGQSWLEAATAEKQRSSSNASTRDEESESGDETILAPAFGIYCP